MNYHDVRMPEFVEVFAVGGPRFATSCAGSNSGREVRSRDRQEAMHYYTIKNCALSAAQFEIFKAFFYARCGKMFSFRFRDHADYRAVNTPLFIEDNAKELQLYKVYYDEVAPFIRKVTKPIMATVKVSVNGEETLVAIEKNTGIIRFNDALMPDSQVCANFSFDVAVRFDHDDLSYHFAADGSVIINDLTLIEVLE